MANTMDIRIRRATPDDIDPIYHLICDLEDNQMDRDAFENIYFRSLNNSLVHYIVAEVNNSVVIGFASLHVQHILHHTNPTGEVQELNIDSRYRDSGIGTLLMNELEGIAQSLNLEEIELTTRTHRERAQSFYKKLGYVNTHLKFVKKLM